MFCQFISNLQQQSSKSAIILYCVYIISFVAVSLMRVVKIQKTDLRPNKRRNKGQVEKTGKKFKKKSGTKLFKIMYQ